MNNKFTITVMTSLFVVTLLFSGVTHSVVLAQERADAGALPEQYSSQAPLTLNQAIHLALQNDRQLEIASLEVAVAARNSDIARSALLPQITAGVSRTWLREAIEIEIPDSDMVFNSGTSFPTTANAQVVVPLFVGGSIPRYMSARRIEMSQQEAENRIRQTVRYNATKAFYSVLQAKQYKILLENTVVRLEAHRDNAKLFYDEGMVDSSDYIQAELQLAEVKQDLFTADKNYMLAISYLNKTIGRDLNDETIVSDDVDLTRLDISVAKGTTLAINNRPELKQLTAEREAARLASTAAKQQLLPSVAAVASAQYLNNDFLENDTIIYGGIQINFDLFNGGKNFAEIGKASKQFMQASLAYEDAKENLQLEVKDAWLSLKESWQQLTVAEKAVEQAKENLRIVENKYDAQMASSTDVLDAQNFLTSAEINFNNSRYAVCLANAKLLHAVGVNDIELITNKEMSDLETKNEQ